MDRDPSSVPKLDWCTAGRAVRTAAWFSHSGPEREARGAPRIADHPAVLTACTGGAIGVFAYGFMLFRSRADYWHMAAERQPNLEELAIELVQLRRRQADLFGQYETVLERIGRFPNEVDHGRAASLARELDETVARIEFLEAQILPFSHD